MNYKEQIEKIARNEDELETSFGRDRLGPEVKRMIKTLPVPLAGIGLGALANPKSRGKGAVVGGFLSIPAASIFNAHLRDKSLRKNSQKYLKRDATRNERLYGALSPMLTNVATLPASGLVSLPLSLASSLNTPESQVKRRARAMRDGLSSDDTKGLYFFNNKRKVEQANQNREE